MGVGLNLYLSDNKQWLIFASYGFDKDHPIYMSSNDDSRFRNSMWYSYMYPHVGDGKVFQCPVSEAGIVYIPLLSGAISVSPQ